MKITWQKVRVVHKDPLTPRPHLQGAVHCRGTGIGLAIKFPQGLQQSIKAQTYVAKALLDLLLQGVKAKDKCLLFRVL